MIITTAPCSAELLDQVPVGGRIVSEARNVVHKVGNGQWVWGLRPASMHTYTLRWPYSDEVISAGMNGHVVTVHHPGLVKVFSWSSIKTAIGLEAGPRFWSWFCRSCKDFDIFVDSSAAHDDGRAHLKVCPKNVAAAPLSKVAAFMPCIRCGERLPADLLVAHLAADHGVLS